ncbi:putative bifunctional diguanylate cyclase/phosphodiesterase [Streptomyces europaeiscabiei]|uniref:EAL domain-containing protein n=1 Tax=Streptomyces europaeiscabiei TaxID=146819 RepID=A0ABU4NDD2_9ACTN|nr:EAL domain-containing protein [Streptomyces europaeiscabiei]MDX2526723.1 EAL domain-containing protein [Streptomyces europaeiscabiei]MDX2765769.1 EAL domain-containing protein [Streptomyces europaeiscabiei]MDX3541512.1 EAL domain-containing protein [Streptomyces europaeiscabiei]MDX3551853.1 EAL domain-containing protein [Streptomyces europaeiscabiei]MDX3669116.1 EAL domain-containing protein [Streptomyces europaeiscabiei]
MSGTSQGPAPAADLVRPAITERHANASVQSSPPSGESPTAPAAFSVAPLAMAVVDRDGLVVTANGAMGTLLSTGAEPLVGRVAADLVDLASDTRTWHAYREVLRGRQARLRCTRRLKQPDGTWLWVQVSVAPLPEEERAVLLSVADISANRQLQARLRHLQMHDPVTRLPNRTLFFEQLSAALEREAYDEVGTGRIGLVYLDLDGFKAVNDTLGHRAGDRLLTAVAERLTRCADEAALLRTAGTAAGAPLVARLGGDEFALLVEDSTGTEQLADLADSVLKALQAPFDLAGQRLSVSASIGVVERQSASTTATGLMQAADTTLYWAKADGKARWTLFDPERNAHRMTRQALSSTLRAAVGRGEFVLDYQPLVGMAQGEVRGVEALVRWHHPQFGLLTPNRFISLAEEDGSIVQLGRWILATACRQARRWQIDHPDRAPIFVSVNVAVRQVWDSDLVADVAEILAETGLAPHLLQLELTESALMGSAGRPLQALKALSDMGVRIAIDDFGTGYSNLAYLSRLPVSVLKLDGAFVRGFQYESGEEGGAAGDDGQPNPADEIIVEALVQLAHRLGLSVTAEGVETDAQASRLRRLGCDTGQGWLYSRAVPPERIAELLGAAACPQA